MEWWNAERDPVTEAWRYEGCDESLSYLEGVWDEKGPFDAILGFSQGAAMTALFSGMLESKQKVLPRCIICISGIKVRDERFDGWYDGIRRLPSFHLCGSQDPVKIFTNRLIRSFEKPVVVEHERGHVVGEHGEKPKGGPLKLVLGGNKFSKDDKQLILAAGAKAIGKLTIDVEDTEWG